MVFSVFSQFSGSKFIHDFQLSILNYIMSKKKENPMIDSKTGLAGFEALSNATAPTETEGSCFEGNKSHLDMLIRHIFEISQPRNTI